MSFSQDMKISYCIVNCVVDLCGACVGSVEYFSWFVHEARDLGRSSANHVPQTTNKVQNVYC